MTTQPATMTTMAKTKMMLKKHKKPIIIFAVGAAVIIAVVVILVVFLKKKKTSSSASSSSSSSSSSSFGSSSTVASSAPASCTTNNVYLFMVGWGNFPVMGNDSTYYSSTGQTVTIDTTDHGNPYLQLCSTGTSVSGMLPVNVYSGAQTNGTVDPSDSVTQIYGTTNAATIAYQGTTLYQGNQGLPLGYLYPSATSLGSSVTLVPVYLLTTGTSQIAQVISLSNGATLSNGDVYTVVRTLGYTLPMSN